MVSFWRTTTTIWNSSCTMSLLCFFDCCMTIMSHDLAVVALQHSSFVLLTVMVAVMIHVSFFIPCRWSQRNSGTIILWRKTTLTIRTVTIDQVYCSINEIWFFRIGRRHTRITIRAWVDSFGLSTCFNWQRVPMGYASQGLLMSVHGYHMDIG